MLFLEKKWMKLEVKLDKMGIDDYTLEELIELVQNESFDDIDDDIAFEIVDRISYLKSLEVKDNPFKGLIIMDDLDVGELPEGLTELNKRIENEGKNTELEG